MAIRSVVALALLVCAAQAGLTQTPNSKDVTQLVRAEARSQKAQLVAQAMNLNSEQSELFWPLYREYDNEKDKLFDERLKNLTLFSDNYQSMTDETAAVLGRAALKIAKNRLKLEQKTYKRMSRQLGALIAVRFMQVDRQVALLQDLQIMSSLPLIATPEELGFLPLPE